MAEVKWTARRVSDGVLVDVTGDTGGTPLVAPTANALEGGGAQDFYAQDTDPGEVGTGSVWKDTTAQPYLWWERNAVNDGWDAIVQITVSATGSDEADAGTTALSVDGDAVAGNVATASGFGNADASISAITVESGTIADAQQLAQTTDGDAASTATSTTVTGDATSGIKALRGAVEASVLVDSTAANARVRATASDITLTASDDILLTATDDITLTADGDISVNPLGAFNIAGSGIHLDISMLPIADPVSEGQLWNDTGVVKVSAG